MLGEIHILFVMLRRVGVASADTVADSEGRRDREEDYEG